MISRAATLALLGTAVVAAGCGGSGKAGGGSGKAGATDAGFRAAYLRQLGPLRSTGGELTTALQAASHESDAQVQHTFARLARQARPVVAGLAALRPPARFRADITAMHDWLARAASDLRAIAVAAGAHHAGAAQQATRKLVSDSVHVKDADRRLSAALGLVVD